LLNVTTDFSVDDTPLSIGAPSPVKSETRPPSTATPIETPTIKRPERIL
jgi:hypothetical protein